MIQREDFEKMVVSGKINRQHLDPLLQLASGKYCVHRSWGCGQITSVDTVFARFAIDFPGKPGHTMDLGFAAESLKPISRDHILARKSYDLENLRQMAAANHRDLVKLVLKSYGGKATLEQIQQILVPEVIQEDWKKWWDNAKHELKKDGHFQVPTKKTDPIVYQEQEVSLDNRLLEDFKSAKGLKAKVNVATEALKNLPDTTDKVALCSAVILGLNADIVSHQRTQPAAAIEAIFVRDDLTEASGLTPQTGELGALQIWAQGAGIGAVLAEIPAAKHRRMLQTFKAANPEKWWEALLVALNEIPAKLCSECASVLIQEGHLRDLKEMLARLISHHKATSELLLWLAKERSDSFADILGPEVFRAMMTAMERDQFNEKRSNRLRDCILSDQELILDLISSADLEVIKDLTRALQLSPVFDDMDKRSLLARIVKAYPTMQALITGEQTRQDNSFVVSWESLERRKAEYNELVQKKIPANSKEIAIARSYGDLRENHEYKAAKEMQKILMRRKGELENQLVRARGTDFSNARTDAVSIGTRVHAMDLDTQHAEHFSILGAWDSDPAQGIISYLTPMAQAMIGHSVGEEVDFELEGTKKRFRIDSIEAIVQPPPAPVANAAPAEPAPAVVPPPVAENPVPVGTAAEDPTAAPAT